MSAACFRLTAKDNRPVPRTAPVPRSHTHCVESARRWWSLVVATPCGLAPLITAPDVTKQALPTLLFPSHYLAVLITALLHTSHRFAHHRPSLMSSP
jgi:hypothetical protein